jgi:hypothetical protein
MPRAGTDVRFFKTVPYCPVWIFGTEEMIPKFARLDRANRPKKAPPPHAFSSHSNVYESSKSKNKFRPAHKPGCAFASVPST